MYNCDFSIILKRIKYSNNKKKINDQSFFLISFYVELNF